ncbi:uncharacterized protein LOC133173988 [Saccostrea echinata]|uniref:uncharacterized protein LOC133173988 n=1 Tax=Saccostrea echinata TaxID=191078 RepID=UPI002A810F8D|nr:uncharacterized protein LOC133173988 [Saccostrea echinata]
MVKDNFVQTFLESRLTTLHNTSAPSVTNYKLKVISFVVAAFLISLLPILHIGVFYAQIWVPQKGYIDRRTCRNTCFDTIFRGSYENPGETTYKHVYFNATWQTSRIWIFTVVFILLAYESIKYLIPLVRRRGLRGSMFALYLINLYPHYYSWWSYFSYYNEDFYNYFKHHFMFTVTEIIATCIVLNLCDRRNEVVSWKVLAIVSINLMHILVSGVDQFVSHVIQGKGTSFQNARDIGLMIPDSLHLIIPLWQLMKSAKDKDVRIKDLCSKEEIIMSIVFICLFTLLGRVM